MIQLTQTDFDALPRPKDVTASQGVQYVKEIEGKPYIFTYVDSYPEKNGTTSWKVSQEEVKFVSDVKSDIIAGDKLLTQIASYLNSQGLTADDLLSQIQGRLKSQK